MYTAVMLAVPTGSVVLVKLALPPESVAVPRVALPFKKVTLPVGVPAAAETVAVMVTACPKVAGFSDEDSDTEVVGWPIC